MVEQILACRGFNLANVVKLAIIRLFWAGYRYLMYGPV